MIFIGEVFSWFAFMELCISEGEGVIFFFLSPSCIDTFQFLASDGA